MCLLVACSDGSGPAPADAGDQAGEAPEVVVIGVDGAEWQVIRDMVDRGELPGFARLMEEGAHGHLLNPGPQVSPVVWTTFATGHFSSEHGILDFVFPFTKGSGKQPVDVSLRQKPALWNLLDAHGKRSTVIGWFVSWPAEAIDGHIVSDRAFQNLDHSVWPESLADASEEVRQSVFQDEDELYARFFPWPYDAAQAEDAASEYHEAARMVAGRVDSRIRSDEYLRRMTERLVDEPVDLFISYFRIVDIVSHSLWRFYDDSDWDEPTDPQRQRLLGDVLEESYRYVDEVIVDMLERFGGRSNIIVVSDHGFGSGTGRYQPRASDLLTGNHRPNGVILAHGPDIAAGRIEQPITIMEVFPTLANLLDVPIADTVPGDVAFQLLTEDFSEAQPPQYVVDYDFGWRGVEREEADAAAQAEEMESLRGLGYIGEGVTLADEAEAGAFDFWSVDANLLVSNLHGNVAYYLLQGDAAAADAATNALKRNTPALLPQLIARVRAKIHSLRREVPGGEKLAPGLDAWVERHEGTASG
jgi:predicted AlkP superfamily phosphohydrolase/phosphomutase